jgi:hypothetical protein
MIFRGLTTSLSCLTLVGVLFTSAPTAGSEPGRPAASPSSERPRHRAAVEGCFEPPPEPVSPPPPCNEGSRP